MLTHGIYLNRPTGSVQSLSGHAIAYRWRSLPRVRRHRASSPQGCSSNGCCLFRFHHGPINVRLSFPTPTIGVKWSQHVESMGGIHRQWTRAIQTGRLLYRRHERVLHCGRIIVQNVDKRTKKLKNRTPRAKLALMAHVDGQHREGGNSILTVWQEPCLSCTGESRQNTPIWSIAVLHQIQPVSRVWCVSGLMRGGTT